MWKWIIGVAMLCCLPAFGLAAITEVDCADAETECYYVAPGGTGSPSSCADCQSSPWCLNPQYIAVNCMDDMNDQNDSCTGATCDSKAIVFKDGWYENKNFTSRSTTYQDTANRVGTITYDDGTNAGTIFHALSTHTCTNCWITAETLGTQPPDGLAATEILMDWNRDGEISYENSVMIDCGVEYPWQSPNKPPDRDGYEVIPFALESGTWTIQGISTMCRNEPRFGGIAGQATSIYLDRVGFQTDTHNIRSISLAKFEDKTEVVIESSAFMNGGHDSFVRSPYLGDSGHGMLLMENVAEFNIVDSYFYGFRVGPSFIEVDKGRFGHSVLWNYSTHGMLFDTNQGTSAANTTSDVVFYNSLFGNPTYGRCGDSQRYCMTQGAATEAAAVGATCSCSNGGDHNDDACGDNDCAADEYCGLNSWAMSRKLCRPSQGNADCSTDKGEQTDFTPSSASAYGGITIPTNRNWVEADAQECLEADNYFSWGSKARAYTYLSPRSYHGYMVDKDWDDANGVFEWGTTHANTGTSGVDLRCLQNETMTNEGFTWDCVGEYNLCDESCGATGDCCHLHRGNRLAEPGEGADGICFVGNTYVGNGTSFALSYTGSRWNRTGSGGTLFGVCSETSSTKCAVDSDCPGVETCEQMCDAAVSDCDARDWCWVNNAILDFQHGGTLFQAPKYASRTDDDQKGGSGWEFEDNAIGGGPATLPFTRNNGNDYDGEYSWKVMNVHMDTDNTPQAASSTETFALTNTDAYGVCRHSSTSTISCGFNATDCDGTGQTIDCDLGAANPCGSNDASLTTCTSSSSPDVSFDASGVWVDSSNFWVPNLADDLVDYYGQDWRPDTGSSLINAGQSGTITREANSGGNYTIDSTDFFHNTRTGGYDIGAFEFGSEQTPPPSSTYAGTGMYGGELYGVSFSALRTPEVYDCDEDPLGLSWNHLRLVQNWENCGSNPCETSYSTGGTDEYIITGGDSAWEELATAKITTTATKNGVYGAQDVGATGTAGDYWRLTGDAMIDATFKGEYRVGFWWRISDGVTACADGQWGIRLSDTILNLGLKIEGTEPYDLKWVQRDVVGVSVCLIPEAISEDTWYFIQTWYDGTTAYLDIDNGAATCSYAVGDVDTDNGSASVWYFPASSGSACEMSGDDLWITVNSDLNVYDHVVTNQCTDAPAGL